MGQCLLQSAVCLPLVYFMGLSHSQHIASILKVISLVSETAEFTASMSTFQVRSWRKRKKIKRALASSFLKQNLPIYLTQHPLTSHWPLHAKNLRNIVVQMDIFSFNKIRVLLPRKKERMDIGWVSSSLCHIYQILITQCQFLHLSKWETVSTSQGCLVKIE